MKTYLPNQFVNAGVSLAIIQNPQVTSPGTYTHEISRLLEALEACDLDDTAATANQLRGISIPFDPRRNQITGTASAQLQSIAGSIVTTLGRESLRKPLALTYPQSVSQKLRALPANRTLTEAQNQFVNEAIRAIEVESYRAAIVLGWTFAYDIVRQWAFDTTLNDFNHYLQQKYANKSQVANYDDFWASPRPPSEFEVLDTLKGPNNSPALIPTRIVDNLLQHLRTRNNYAHPNFMSPSAHRANAYIEDLVDIVTASPFV